MQSKLSLLSIAIILLLSGCTKQMTDASANTALSNDQSASAAITTVAADPGWRGFYTGTDVQNSDTLSAADFIGNGIAKLPIYSNDNDVYSRINYNILRQHVIQGDSVIYEVKIKNPKDRHHQYWDVILSIKGTKHDAFVNFVADSADIQNTRAFVGDAEVTNVPQLVYDFEKFTAVKLIFKNNKLSVRLNGALVASFKYGSKNKIGVIKSISFGGKGYPSCTDVKLANSITNNLILTENFNTDGQSTVVYH